MHRSGRAPYGLIVGIALASVWVTAVVARNRPVTAQFPDPHGLAAARRVAAPEVTVRPTARTPAQAKKAGASPRIRKAVDWAKLNPAYEGATFVNDRATCITCHEETSTKYDHTSHAAALAFAPGAANNNDCESCHGPGSKHVENEGKDIAYARLSPAGQSAVCTQCHVGGAQIGFKSGPHFSAEVSCTSCHLVMDKKSEHGLLSKSSASQLCYQCHTEVRAETLKSSHHPIREGRMECSSCHNPHASTEAVLVKNTVNETCATCHAEKRGPFLWEHAPARESCATCHTPHGSNQRYLLTQREPFLCLSCHSYGGHINLPRYNRTSNSYGNGCTNCHISTHGSNHPSGAKQTR